MIGSLRLMKSGLHNWDYLGSRFGNVSTSGRPTSF